MRRFMPLPKCICPKVNAIARLEFELTFYDVAAQQISNYTIGTPPLWEPIEKCYQ